MTIPNFGTLGTFGSARPVDQQSQSFMATPVGALGFVKAIPIDSVLACIMLSIGGTCFEDS